MNLTFGYSSWFILLCIVVGLLYALGLYYKESQNFGALSTKYNSILGIFRFLTVTIICLLLLEPVMRHVITEQKRPIVVVAQDNSESIQAAMNETEKAAYSAKIKNLIGKLSEQYEVKTYAFGDEVRSEIDFSFKDKTTNISTVFDELYDTYSNQNLRSIILASDGIFNQGNSPIYTADKLNIPVYTIALGDTIRKKDISLKRTYNNQIAYLGDKFSVQIDIAAINLNGKQSRLLIRQNGATLVEKPIQINKEDFFITEELLLEAKKAGVQKYNVSILPIDGEITTVNNSKDIYIEVLDSRQRILILAESPHPDLGMLKRMIENNKNYQAEISYPDVLKENINKYDFVILHQLPSLRHNLNNILGVLQEKRIPHWFILGTQTNLSLVNQVQGLLTVQARINQTNDVSAVLENNFNLFTLSSEIAPKVAKYPPLVSPYGDYTARPNATTLLWQKIGTVQSNYPLLLVGEERGIKKAVLAGEGIWKWRTFNYMEAQNFDAFDELFNKLLVYLSAKEDKRKFRAFASNTLFLENERIKIDAELYNANYERINEAEATVEIKDAEGKKYPFSFSKTNNAYTLNAGLLPVGDYTFEAKTQYNGEILSAGGAFSVQSIQLEMFETTADHQLLANLSERSNGAMLYPRQIEELPNMIQASGLVKPLLYESATSQGLIHLKWIFFILMALLSVEWFLRRYWGSY